MALFPCDVCKRRYVGAGNSAYIGWMAGAFSERIRLRLCSPHVNAVLLRCEQHMTLVQRGDDLVGDDTELPTVCQRCGLEPATVTFFANVYERNTEPLVFAATRCAKCQGQLTYDLSTDALGGRQTPSSPKNDRSVIPLISSPK